MSRTDAKRVLDRSGSAFVSFALVLVLAVPPTAGAIETSKPPGELPAVSAQSNSRGEALLEACVGALKQKLSPSEERALFAEWEKLRAALGTARFEAQLESSSATIARLSPPAVQRGALLISYFRLLRVFPSHEPDRRWVTSAGSLVTQIFTHRPFADRAEAGRVTQALSQVIARSTQLAPTSKVLAQARLLAFESALVGELERAHALSTSERIVNKAELRPLLFGLGGTAAFATAVVMAQPLLSASVAASGILSISPGVGKIVATTVISAVGSSGVDVLKDIAIERWLAARAEAIARDIPLGCALAKHVELAKDQELDFILRSAAHGAKLGAGLSGVTLLTPKILSAIGGTTLEFAASRGLPLLARAGRAGVAVGSVADKIVFLTVVGLVGFGGASEGYGFIKSLLEGYSYNRLLAEIDRDAERAAKENNKDLLAKLSTLRRQALAAQSMSYGQTVLHGVDVAICGILLTQMAEGEFMQAIRGTVNEVLDATALMADDAPTGVNAAIAAMEGAAAGAEASAAAVRLGLLRAKLAATEDGMLSPRLSEAIDSYLAMPADVFQENLQGITRELQKER